MKKEKKFRKVVKSDKMNLLGLALAIIGNVIWIFNSFIELNYWTGIWTGITATLIFYWIGQYLESRAVYYVEI